MGPELSNGRMPLPNMQSQSSTRALKATAQIPAEQNAATSNPHLTQQVAGLKSEKFVHRSSNVDKNNVNKSLPKEGSDARPRISLKSLTVFNDSDSGKVVSVMRDMQNGKEIQIPDDRALQRYKMVKEQYNQMSQTVKENLKTSVVT